MTPVSYYATGAAGGANAGVYATPSPAQYYQYAGTPPQMANQQQVILFVIAILELIERTAPWQTESLGGLKQLRGKTQQSWQCIESIQKEIRFAKKLLNN